MYHGSSITLYVAQCHNYEDIRLQLLAPRHTV